MNGLKARNFELLKAYPKALKRLFVGMVLIHFISTNSLTASDSSVIFKMKSAFPELVTHQVGTYLQFLLHKATRSIPTPLWMGC